MPLVCDGYITKHSVQLVPEIRYASDLIFPDLGNKYVLNPQKYRTLKGCIIYWNVLTLEGIYVIMHNVT